MILRAAIGLPVPQRSIAPARLIELEDAMRPLWLVIQDVMAEGQDIPPSEPKLARLVAALAQYIPDPTPLTLDPVPAQVARTASGPLSADMAALVEATLAADAPQVSPNRREPASPPAQPRSGPPRGYYMATDMDGMPYVHPFSVLQTGHVARAHMAPLWPLGLREIATRVISFFARPCQ